MRIERCGQLRQHCKHLRYGDLKPNFSFSASIILHYCIILNGQSVSFKVINYSLFLKKQKGFYGANPSL